MRFFADENVSRFVVEKLRSSGHDVETVSPLDRGAPDQRVLELASDDDRILITEDRDFGELVVRQKLKSAGVVLLELDRLSNAAEADRVGSAITQLGERLRGQFCVVEPGHVRLRPLST